MPFCTIPPQRCSLHWSQSPCQVVKPAHPYACSYTWNSVHLFVQLCGCRSRHADRMPFAPRPMIQHRSADWEKEATKNLREHWYAAEELPFLVEKVVSAYHQTDLKLIYVYIQYSFKHFHFQTIKCLPFFAKYLLLTSVIHQKRNCPFTVWKRRKPFFIIIMLKSLINWCCHYLYFYTFCKYNLNSLMMHLRDNKTQYLKYKVPPATHN